jgi:hypothetical protein
MKKFLFGESCKESGFSVLSFFFERVQGHVERKHIKTPVDSIRAFRDVFSQVLDNVHSRAPELRVVVIIDNIDRIPPDQARDFWSTMQTFFGDHGGLRSPKTRKYWLLAPFSIEALSFIFRDGTPLAAAAANPDTASQAKAKAYIDRTFGLAFYVPPPILTNWRRYLLTKLRNSFPEHPESDLIAVRDVFDFARSEFAITPREMKLFVNSLVVLYRLRGDEISLTILAIYILHRDKIVGTAISDQLISSREQSLIDEPDWRVPIAALHFGVGLEEATQLLLQEPMLKALREGSKENLKALEGRPGFLDVLRRVMLLQLESPTSQNGTMLAQTAATIASLQGASKPDLTGVWRDIRGRLKNVKDWALLQESTADGIGNVLAHTPDVEKYILCQTLAASLSQVGSAVPDPGNYQTPYELGRNWLCVANTVADAAAGKLDPKIRLLPGIRLKLELLQLMTEFPKINKAAFTLNESSDAISKGLATEISEGRYLRTQVPLVLLLSTTMQTNLQWPAIVSACAERLRVNLDARETQSLIRLLLTAAAIENFSNALTTLKDLSIQGHLSNLIQQHQNTPAARDEVITAVILANPAFDRPTQLDQSSAGDDIFNGLSGAEEFDPSQIDNISEVIKSVQAEAILFEVGAKNQKISRLTAAVIGNLTESAYRFNIEPKMIIEERKFLEAHANLNPINAFLANLNDATDVPILLASQPFEVDRSQFYRATLGVSSGAQGNRNLDYLQAGILALDKSQWEQSLNARSGPYFELLGLAGDLRKRREEFELLTPAGDAALDQIRNAGKAEPPPSDELRERLAKLVQLLSDSLRTLLIRNVVDDMMGHTDATQITRLIETAGDHITFEEKSDPDRIMRRIFSPVVANPTERSAVWMATTIGRKLELFRYLPVETKNEFGWRLRTALQNKESLGPVVTEALTNAAGLLKVSLSPNGDDGPGQTP